MMGIWQMGLSPWLFIAVFGIFWTATAFHLVPEAGEERLVFKQRLNHFDAFGKEVIKQRYYRDLTYWKPGGPVFFVPGGESSLDSMPYRDFGLRLARAHDGALFALEHRFYGESIPFDGNHTRAFDPKTGALGLLSVEQALSDAVHFLKSVVLNNNMSRNENGVSKVITFGGSYSGVLAAYLRFTAPHIVNGALAASAPVLLNGINLSTVSPYDYYQRITEAAERTYPGCAEATRQAFAELLARNDSQFIRDINLCETSEALDRDEIVQLARVQFANAAMSNFPPGSPTEMLRLCSSLANFTNPKKWALFFSNLFSKKTYCLNMAANRPSIPGRVSNVACGDLSGCGTGWAGEAWDFQSSTQVIQPIGTNNVTDMFPPRPYNLTQQREHASRRFDGAACSPYGLSERFALDKLPDMADTLYSNVIWSNGLQDPWAVGGIFGTKNSIVIPNGAHHSDLSEPTPWDPIEIVVAREKERKIISAILSESP